LGYRFKRQKKIVSIFLVKTAGSESEIELLPEAVHFNTLFKSFLAYFKNQKP